MKLKFFSVPAIDSAAAEREVNQFLARHRVVRVDRQLVVADGGAYWALCVGYLDSQGAAKVPVKKGKVDYKEVLAPEDFTRYLELRSLRKALAERDGVPAYKMQEAHKGSNRVIRGGSWNSNARNVRAAYRNGTDPGNRNDNVGFRLARAQKTAGGPPPDPTPVVSGRAGRRTHLGAQCASRTMDFAPTAHRSSPLCRR